MTIPSKYGGYHESDWQVYALRGVWRPDLSAKVLLLVEKQLPTRHPQTISFTFTVDGQEKKFYLKVYHRPSSGINQFKDFWRDSKAVRALKQGVALAERGFNSPIPIAAGEERRLRLLKRAFLLTLGIQGVPLQLYLYQHNKSLGAGAGLARKRVHLKGLAVEIRRLHQSGFVHGDLIPPNIFVRESGDGEIVFLFMDNDRTRHYPVWLPHRLWRRNLVQLNRFVLAGISLQDRMRFLRYYLWRKVWTEDDRRLMKWLEKRTRKRRRECDQVRTDVSFRELMRWDGELSGHV